jgi:hypothetical protein
MRAWFLNETSVNQKTFTTRDPVTRFSTSGFFYQTTPSGPLTHGFKPFCIWLRIRRDIRLWNRLSGVRGAGKWQLWWPIYLNGDEARATGAIGAVLTFHPEPEPRMPKTGQKSAFSASRHHWLQNSSGQVMHLCTLHTPPLETLYCMTKKFFDIVPWICKRRNNPWLRGLDKSMALFYNQLHRNRYIAR